jgi:DNA-binding MarR family transcriptional regulator
MALDTYNRLLQEVDEIPPIAGISPSDIFDLPETLALLLRHLMRQGTMTAHDLAAHLEVTVQQANDLGEQLVAKGYLLCDTSNAEDGQTYCVLFARMRKRNIPSQLL